MKVLVIPVPNMVPNEGILQAISNFFNEIGVATKLTIIEEPDAQPSAEIVKTPFIKVIDKCISNCGCGDDVLAFKTKFRAMALNNGDINFELLEILTARKRKTEIQYLKDTHLEWLPAYADRLLRSLQTVYGENV